MPEFPAQLLAEWTGGRWTARPVSPLSGFCIDSRQIRAGQVFVAIRTAQRDGHDFVGAAAAAGAAAALVAAADPAAALPQLVVGDPLAAFQAIAREHRRAFRGRVIGISGSAGKTSTKDLLALLLGGGTSGVPATGELSAAGPRPAARVLATEGNLNNHLGVPLTLTRLEPAVHEYAVVEAGISAPGEMDVLARMIEPDVSLITLIAAAHLAELGGLEGVAREKSRLSAATRPGGVALFPSEAMQYPAFRDLATPRMAVARVDVLPSRPPAGVVCFTVTHREDATVVNLLYGTTVSGFTFRRVSDGMAQNAALALSAALWLGIPAELARQRLTAWQPARWRGEVRHDGGRLLYLDCYNANPASMADALSAFDAIAPATQPRLYLIGTMEELGPEAAAHHRELGAGLRLRTEDRAFVVGSHAGEIQAGALSRGATAQQVRVVDSADAVAADVRLWRGSVFVKGSRRYRLERAVEPVTPAPGQAGGTRPADAAPAGP